MGKQVFSHLQDSTAPSHVTVTWNEKTHHSKCPSLPPSFLNFVYGAWIHLVWSIPLVCWAHMSRVCPSNLAGAPILLTSAAKQRAEVAWALWKPSSVIRKASLCYQTYLSLYSAQIQNMTPTPATVKTVNSTPAKTITGGYDENMKVLVSEMNTIHRSTNSVG